LVNGQGEAVTEPYNFLTYFSKSIIFVTIE